jgi:iron complex transport system ATP-binding protein
MIEARDLSFSYRSGPSALKSISFRAREGELISLMGPNGCGKTTLLKAILGFLVLPKEKVFIGGRPLERWKRKEIARKLSYVPQAHLGVFHYSAREMVLMGRTGDSGFWGFRKRDAELADEALAMVGLGYAASRSYLELSGGERQLVLIARALCQRSCCLVMDEPASGLDLGNQARLLERMSRLRSEFGLTIVLSTHQPEHALYLGGRAIMMKEGRVIDDGPVAKIVSLKSVAALYDLERGHLERLSFPV